jgi:hypothetical protein
MISIKELRRWLNTLDQNRSVAIDDGGLNLVEVNENDEETDEYIEVGGVSEDEPEFKNFYKCPTCSHPWHEFYTAKCDSECPKCGTRNISPFKSEDA